MVWVVIGIHRAKNKSKYYIVSTKILAKNSFLTLN
jgi:hypothetical protein